MEIITDLACELLRRVPQTSTGLTVTTADCDGITIHKTIIETIPMAREIGKPTGTYLNLDTTNCRPRTIIISNWMPING